MERHSIHTESTDAGTILHRGVIALVAVVALATTVVVGLAATVWIGRPFPGFFVLDNGVVASIGRPSWPASRNAIYQHVVATIDDAPVQNGADVYGPVAAQQVGTAFTYGLDGSTAQRTLSVRSRMFSNNDYWAIFGGYVVTGLLYLLLAIVAALMVSDLHLARILIILGSAGGAYALSAVGIYGPHGPLRIHAFAEAIFPATLVSLALAFPSSLPGITRPATAVAWWLALAIAVPYQTLIDDPRAYSALHGTSELYLGAAGMLLVVRLVVAAADRGLTAVPALQSALAGAVLGLGAPAIIFVISGVTGGQIPVNTCTTTAFLFPLCFLYGLVREHRATRQAATASFASAAE